MFEAVVKVVHYEKVVVDVQWFFVMCKATTSSIWSALQQQS